MIRKLLTPVATLIVLFILLPTASFAQSTAWFNSSWQYRVPITITNTSGSPLTNFQVKILLNSSFNFANAKTDGSDVRLTAGDGVTQIPFWVETWNAGTDTADFWVQVPSVPTTGTTIYLYYDNAAATSASNGNATFLFFDDFEASTPGLGYWTLGSPETELVQDQSWEDSAPHTLSVLDLKMGGHTYWGYYGTQEGCAGVGLAFSEDLVTWTKYPNNPLFTNARWPRVVQIGSTLYMVHDKNYCSTPELDLATSTDGINWTDIEQLVPPNYLGGEKNQNADLWLNPNDGKYYLYWYNGDGSTVWNIMARSATSPTGLNSTTSEVKVLTSGSTLASPDMMYYNGTYFLSTEVLDGSGLWNVWLYSSTTGPTSGFTAMPGNPVLNNGSACMFQTVFGTTLHEYYCNLNNGTWTLQHRQATITAARPTETTSVIDPLKWTSLGGSWSTVVDTQQNGTTGYVAQGSTSAVQILASSFSGTDYVVEAYGKQVQGRVWGLGFRVNGSTNFYSINLYDDLNATLNLYNYAWVNNTNSANTLGNAAVGTVNPNTWYKLSVKAHGSAFDIYKDDVFQIHTADGSYASGGIALYGEAGTVANFNNVLVRQYASADPTSIVGPQQIPGPTVASVALNPASVAGGTSSTATVTLSAPAPAAGTIVMLSSSNTAAATVPVNVTVAAGATTANFTVTTKAVGAIATPSISATVGTSTKSATLTVNPPSLTSLTLFPDLIMIGGFPGVGTVTISSPAPVGGLVINLSDNSKAINESATVTVPAGATSASFVFTTTPVLIQEDSLTAVFGSVSKSATIILIL